MSRQAEIVQLRVPPHASEAEQSVLGSLLLDNAQWARARQLVQEAHFYRQEHRLIFGAIGALVDAGRLADVVTVFEHLKSQGKSEDCGGLPYLNALAQSVPSVNGLQSYARTVAEKARLRQLIAASDRIATAAFGSGDLEQAESQVASIVEEIACGARPARALVAVDLAEQRDSTQAPQEWCWAGLVPMGYVTMLNGHGGSGKSTLALQLLLCAAADRECLGIPTRPGTICCFYSAEDPKDLVLRRLGILSASLGVDLQEVRQRLHVLDATEIDPVLFREQRVEGVSSGAVTDAYRALQQYVEQHRIDLLVIDNASDTYEASEILRPLVRAFMRSLAQLTKSTGGATVLVAHVDKGTSRAPVGATGSESYSGSTAWHNSARSRLFLMERERGSLELRHEKCNVGPRRDPLRLSWPPGGAMELEDAAPAATQWIADRNDLKAILALIAEYAARGAFR